MRFFLYTLSNSHQSENFIKISLNFLVTISVFFFFSSSYAKSPPESFADLSDRVSPAVVNIATTVVLKNAPQREMPEFPPGSPFEEFFKDFMEKTFAIIIIVVAVIGFSA